MVWDHGDPNGVRYAQRGQLFWELSVVSLDAGSPSIALDSADRPHLAFESSSFLPPPRDANLIYAFYDGSGWQLQTIDQAGEVGAFSQIKVDLQDRPHISYADLSNEDLRYAYRDDAGWHTETIDGQAVALWSDLDLDASNKPHVAYCSFADVPGGCSLRYATRDSAGSWAIQLVDTDGGADVAVAVDELNRPHISYKGRNENEILKYATYDGVAWSTEIVDSDDRPTGWDTDIETDSNNIPHISYVQVINRAFPDDPRRGHLKYASLGPGGQWFTEYVDIRGIVVFTSIAVDQHDRPRIAYKYCCDQPFVPGISRAQDMKYAEPLSAFLMSGFGV